MQVCLALSLGNIKWCTRWVSKANLADVRLSPNHVCLLLEERSQLSEFYLERGTVVPTHHSQVNPAARWTETAFLNDEPTFSPILLEFQHSRHFGERPQGTNEKVVVQKAWWEFYPETGQ